MDLVKIWYVKTLAKGIFAPWDSEILRLWDLWESEILRFLDSLRVWNSEILRFSGILRLWDSQIGHFDVCAWRENHEKNHDFLHVMKIDKDVREASETLDALPFAKGEGVRSTLLHHWDSEILIFLYCLRHWDS